MQRRRKPKAAPANVFAGGQKPKKPKKTNPIPAPSAPPVPIKQLQPVKNIPKEATVESPQEKIPEITPTQEEENLEVVESQILGTPRRKTHGLKKENQEKISEEKEDVSAIDMEAQEALDRAKKRSEEAKLSPKKPISSPPPRQKKKKTSSRGKNKTYQPAAREKRLNRARHMEYKYEMRGLLAEISVPEEHRSSLIGSVWAKGERQTAAHAKEFVETKINEGIINQDQAIHLIKLIDDYTVRR